MSVKSTPKKSEEIVEEDADINPETEAGPELSKSMNSSKSILDSKMKTEKPLSSFNSGGVAEKMSAKQSEKQPEKMKAMPGFWSGLMAKCSHYRDMWRSSPLTEQFNTDCVVQLVNRANRKALRVTDFGDIDCSGERKEEHDEQQHFIVTNHGGNVVSLRSLTFPLAHDKFLRVKTDGRLYCNGNGKSDECKFRIHETGKYVTFESYQYMYHHIACHSDGSMIAPRKMWQKSKGTMFDVKIIGHHKNTPTGWRVITT